MFKIFNTNDEFIFKIPNFQINYPVNILTMEDKYLSCAEFDNIVDFFPLEGIRQRWILENDSQDPHVFYIKSAFERFNFTQYLGSPNQCNQVFMYTSKNKYTKWSIINISKDNYLIKYIGEKFDKNQIEMVVARYNENIDWTLAYNDIVILYNKGSQNIKGLNNIINIPNLGREGHTYLYHIINNYDNLKNKTVFTQGDPFEHNNTFLYGIDNHDKTEDVQSLGFLWSKKENIPPFEFLEKNKTITNYGLIYLKTIIDSNLLISEFEDEGINLININARIDYPEYKDLSLVVAFLYRVNFPYIKSLDIITFPPSKCLNKINFTYCALFSVVKKNILNFEKKVYENLLIELISKNDDGGVNGYILERLWLYIFEDI